MRPLKIKVNITLDCDLVEVLREVSERDDRSLSGYINFLLRQSVTDKDLWKVLNEK